MEQKLLINMEKDNNLLNGKKTNSLRNVSKSLFIRTEYKRRMTLNKFNFLKFSYSNRKTH